MYAKSAEVYDAIYEALGKDYAQEAVGLEVTHDPEGLMGRGLYLGAKP